jgi:glucokinase
MDGTLIGVDFGATDVKIGCFDSQLKLRNRSVVSTDADLGPESVVERIVVAIEQLVGEAGFGPESIVAAGIGTPGPADYENGIIIRAANLPFRNTPIRQMLSTRLNCPVAFDNDANVACWGEFTAGAGKGVKDMIFITLGTGVGGGIISGGRLIHGCGGNSSEIGHIIMVPDGRPCGCGQRGCVEAYASASQTALRATEALEAGEPSSLKSVLDEQGQITCRDVYEHLQSGDALAKRITDETARLLGVLCVGLFHVTEPSRIVFAGGMIAAGAVLLDRIRYYFDQEMWAMKKEPVEIVFSSLGENAGITGAAGLGRELLKGPV